MLKYDEWVVPGEVEYAEQKAAEIESQIQAYHKKYITEEWKRDDLPIYIQITEHIVGKFLITFPIRELTWYDPQDIDIINNMMLNWYRDMVAPIDEPKIFDLPADDIRSCLPEWNESLISDSNRRSIIEEHSMRYNVLRGIEYMDVYREYYINQMLDREFELSSARCRRIMDALIKKLSIENKLVTYTELEEKMGRFLASYSPRIHFVHEPYFFPLAMSENDIFDAIREAYWNASKRSRRILPNMIDNTVFGWYPYDSQLIEMKNHECLYQGKAGDLVIHFLFNFKDMEIEMAYPVQKEKKF